MSNEGDFCVTVYASSSDAVDESFKAEARRLGAAIAEAGYSQCNGGGKYGLMGAVTNGALEKDGAVDCIILRDFVGAHMHDGPFRKTVIVDTMHERKMALYKNGDAFVALPGGLGTLEELAEVASWRQLQMHEKPVVLVNTNGFYSEFWRFFQHAMDTHFVSSACRNAVFIAEDARDALRILRNYRPCKILKTEDLSRADWTIPGNGRSI